MPAESHQALASAEASSSSQGWLDPVRNFFTRHGWLTLFSGASDRSSTSSAGSTSPSGSSAAASSITTPQALRKPQQEDGSSTAAPGVLFRTFAPVSSPPSPHRKIQTDEPSTNPNPNPNPNPNKSETKTKKRKLGSDDARADLQKVKAAKLLEKSAGKKKLRKAEAEGSIRKVEKKKRRRRSTQLVIPVQTGDTYIPCELCAKLRELPGAYTGFAYHLRETHKSHYLPLEDSKWFVHCACGLVYPKGISFSKHTNGCGCVGAGHRAIQHPGCKCEGCMIEPLTASPCTSACLQKHPRRGRRRSHKKKKAH